MSDLDDATLQLDTLITKLQKMREACSQGAIPPDDYFQICYLLLTQIKKDCDYETKRLWKG